MYALFYLKIYIVKCRVGAQSYVVRDLGRERVGVSTVVPYALPNHRLTVSETLGVPVSIIPVLGQDDNAYTFLDKRLAWCYLKVWKCSCS